MRASGTVDETTRGAGWLSEEGCSHHTWLAGETEQWATSERLQEGQGRRRFVKDIGTASGSHGHADDAYLAHWPVGYMTGLTSQSCGLAPEAPRKVHIVDFVVVAYVQLFDGALYRRHRLKFSMSHSLTRWKFLVYRYCSSRNNPVSFAVTLGARETVG